MQIYCLRHVFTDGEDLDQFFLLTINGKRATGLDKEGGSNHIYVICDKMRMISTQGHRMRYRKYQDIPKYSRQSQNKICSLAFVFKKLKRQIVKYLLCIKKGTFSYVEKRHFII